MIDQKGDRNVKQCQLLKCKQHEQNGMLDII